MNLNLGTVAAGTLLTAEFGPFYDFTGTLSNSFSATPQATVYLAGTTTVEIAAANLVQVGNVWCLSINTNGLAGGQYAARITTGQIVNGASVVGQGVGFSMVQCHVLTQVATQQERQP